MKTIDLDEKYIEIIRNAKLRFLPGDASVIFFGSRTSGKNRKYSDIDIAVKGKNITEKNIYDFSEELEESDLPMISDIHLYNELPDFLKEKIDKEGIKL